MAKSKTTIPSKPIQSQQQQSTAMQKYPLSPTPGEALLASCIFLENDIYSKVREIYLAHWNEQYLRDFCEIGGDILTKENHDKQMEMAWRFAARSFIAGQEGWPPEKLVGNGFSADSPFMRWEGKEPGPDLVTKLVGAIAELQKSSAWKLRIADYLHTLSLLSQDDLAVQLSHACHTEGLAKDAYISGLLTQSQHLFVTDTRFYGEE